MAMVQAGMGLTRVVILVGAGVAGSVVLRNGCLSDIIGEIQEMLDKGEKGKRGDGGADIADALTNQVRFLAMEVRQLASSRPITVHNGGSGQTAVQPEQMSRAARGRGLLSRQSRAPGQGRNPTAAAAPPQIASPRPPARLLLPKSPPPDHPLGPQTPNRLRPGAPQSPSPPGLPKSAPPLRAPPPLWPVGCGCLLASARPGAQIRLRLRRRVVGPATQICLRRRPDPPPPPPPAPPRRRRTDRGGRCPVGQWLAARPSSLRLVSAAACRRFKI